MQLWATWEKSSDSEEGYQNCTHVWGTGTCNQQFTVSWKTSGIEALTSCKRKLLEVASSCKKLQEVAIVSCKQFQAITSVTWKHFEAVSVLLDVLLDVLFLKIIECAQMIKLYFDLLCYKINFKWVRLKIVFNRKSLF